MGWNAEVWLERILEDEGWRSGLTDDQAERLLRWALARAGPHPERTGEALRQMMRRIRRVVQASGEEAEALMAVWALSPPSAWANWTPEERLDWMLQALDAWRPGETEGPGADRPPAGDAGLP